MFARPPSLMGQDPMHRPPTPSFAWLDTVQSALVETPWWGWLILAVAGLVVATVLVVFALRVVVAVAAAVGRVLSGVRSWVAGTAASDRDQLTARARVWGELLGSWLVMGQFLVAMGFAAWSMSRTARDVLGVPVPANWLLFAVFEGFALVVMALIKQRADQALPYPGLLAGYWATIGLASVFVSTNGTGVVDSFAYACITLIAGATYALRVSVKRQDTEEELRAAGERRKNRRMAVVRWLHPIERVLVQLALAADENLSADEATERVREERARDALWDLGQAKEAPFPRTGWGQRRALRREHRLERRAQRRIARAGVAGNPQLVARLSAEMQMMQMASTMATSEHTPEQVQEWAQGLVSEGMWSGRAELEAADVDQSEPVVPELEFGSGWFEEDEREPARLDGEGRIAPDPVVSEFVDRPDPWERAEPVGLRGSSARLGSAQGGGGRTELGVDGVAPGPGSGRAGPEVDRAASAPDRVAPVEPDRVEPSTGPDPDRGGHGDPDRADSEAGRTEPASEPIQSEPDLRPGMTVETGSGRLRVKSLKSLPQADRSIRAVDGRTGAHRTFADVQTEMEAAIRSGLITDNVVEDLVRKLKIGKVRGRKLRDWARDTHLFERISSEQAGSSADSGTLTGAAPASSSGVHP